MEKLVFNKKAVAEVCNEVPPSQMNTFSTVGDINHDGLMDIIISGRNGKMVWIENCGEHQEWKVHPIDDVEKMECGGCTYDITGNGFPDIINGSDWRCDELWWWENPGQTQNRWSKRVVAKTGYDKFHDILIGYPKNDGKPYLVFTNQGGPAGTRIFCVPIPENFAESPWPNLELIAEKVAEPVPPSGWSEDGFMPEEGLAVGDIDNDGLNELVCGTHWFKYVDGQWFMHKFASDYICTKVAIGDIDGDGKNEIILSEGDPCIYGKPEGGKLAWFKPGDDIYGVWNEHVIDNFLLDAHSLQVGDICRNGKADIFVGEIGVANEDRSYKGRLPGLYVYENDGKGNFTKHAIDTGTGIHDGVLADMTGKGTMDIVGKPLHGDELWNVFVWYNKQCNQQVV